MTTPNPPSSQYIGDTVAIATRVIYELTGHRWVWPAITTSETVELPPWPATITLQGRPIISVESVQQTYLGGTPVDLNYTVENKHKIRLTDYVRIVDEVMLLGDPSYLTNQIALASNVWMPGQVWQPYAVLPMREITVNYTYGAPPPLQIGWAIEVYAKQLLLAMQGSNDCRLPRRVTNISRQGVSMTILDPLEFLEKGLTGLPEVDQVISMFNPGKAKRPARVYSVDSPPARRTGTTQVEY